MGVLSGRERRWRPAASQDGRHRQVGCGSRTAYTSGRGEGHRYFAGAAPTPHLDDGAGWPEREAGASWVAGGAIGVRRTAGATGAAVAARITGADAVVPVATVTPAARAAST